MIKSNRGTGNHVTTDTSRVLNPSINFERPKSSSIRVYSSQKSINVPKNEEIIIQKSISRYQMTK